MHWISIYLLQNKGWWSNMLNYVMKCLWKKFPKYWRYEWSRIFYDYFQFFIFFHDYYKNIHTQAWEFSCFDVHVLWIYACTSSFIAFFRNSQYEMLAFILQHFWLLKKSSCLQRKQLLKHNCFCNIILSLTHDHWYSKAI